MTISITRVYTRTGDGGETALVGGRRVPKDSPRIVAYGAVDELNACIGVAVAHLEPGPLTERLTEIQGDLFTLGAELGCVPGKEDRLKLTLIASSDSKRLEALIDEVEARLTPLKTFVLPGGSPAASFLHQARTVCRRTEREVLALSRVEPVGEWTLRYLNRLSDLFFVLGRWVGKHMGEKENLWERGLSAHTRRRR